MPTPKNPKRVLYGVFRLVTDELAVPLTPLTITRAGADADRARIDQGVVCTVTIQEAKP
jgi:hypothetical protein